jgi:peptide/nickel transport system ATP-binding protein
LAKTGDVRSILRNPQQAYTQRLLMASPVPDPDRQAQRREQRKLLAAANA